MSDTLTIKPYSFIAELRPGYLYVCVRCDRMSYQIVRSYWDDIIALSKETRNHRIMLEKRITAELRVGDLYRIGAEVASELSGAKLAVYDPITSTKIREFGEMVSTNRGLNAKTFTNFAAAEEWLLGSMNAPWIDGPF
jgi:hypothetical protein